MEQSPFTINVGDSSPSSMPVQNAPQNTPVFNIKVGDSSSTQNTPQNTGAQTSLDPDVVNLAKAIRQQESGGDFTRSGKSGEYGAYQFTNDTWNKTASNYGINVPLQQATPQQQNEVAYKQLKDWKDAGHNVGQIASMWNAGVGEPNAYLGTFSNGKPSSSNAPGGAPNDYGVSYDVPGYAKAVATYYHQYKDASPTPTSTPSDTSAPGEVDPNSVNENDPRLRFLRKINHFLAPTDNPGQASANGGEGTTVGNALGAVSGYQPGQGTLAGNALRAVGAIPAGAVKALMGVAGNADQFLSGLFGNTGNNAFNLNSPTGKEYNDELRGQTPGQKVIKTIGDIALIVGDPANLLSDAGKIGTAATTAPLKLLPEFEEGSNAAARVASAQKILGIAGRGAAEGVALAPFLQGRLPNMSETVQNAVIPLVLGPAIKGLANLMIPKFGEQATKDALTKLEENLSSKIHQAGDPGYAGAADANPEVVQKVLDQKNAFTSGMQKYFDGAGVNFKRGLDFANQKFASLAQREADATGAVPKKNTLLNYIFDTGGGIDGVDTQGRPITQKAQAAQQGIIDEIGPLLRKIYESSGQAIDGEAIGANAIKDAGSGKYGLGDPTSQAREIAQRQIGTIDALHNPNATPAELYKVSQDLRNQAYQHTNSFKTNQTPIDNITAQVKRDIAGVIDDALSKVSDVDKRVTTTIRNAQTRAYTARDFLQHMETLKAPDTFTKTVGKAIGGAAGWHAAGWPGAIVGAGAGSKAVARLQQAFSDSHLTSDVFGKFMQAATKDNIETLKNMAESIISKNETANQEASHNTLIKDFINSIAKKAKNQLPGYVGPIPEGVPRQSFPSGPTIAAAPAGITVEPTGPTTLAGKYTAAAGQKSTKPISQSVLNKIMEQNAASEPYTPANKLPSIRLPEGSSPSRANLPTAKGEPKVYAPKNFSQYEPYIPHNKLPRIKF